MSQLHETDSAYGRILYVHHKKRTHTDAIYFSPIYPDKIVWISRRLYHLIETLYYGDKIFYNILNTMKIMQRIILTIIFAMQVCWILQFYVEKRERDDYLVEL